MAIKKYHVSKNLFDKDTMTVPWYIDTQGRVVASSGGSYSIVVPCNASTTYTCSFPEVPSAHLLRAVSFSTYPSTSTVGTRYRELGNGGTQCTYTTDSTATYMMYFLWNSAAHPSGMTSSQFFAQTMLNGGSTALPYEPYGNTWQEVGYKKYETATDTFTALPHEVIGDGTALSAWSMKGNMQQSGTPTPSNPVYPVETGDKTANLFDKDNTTIQNGYLYDTGSSFSWTAASDSRSIAIPCQSSTQYTLSISSSIPIFRIGLTNDSAPTPRGITCTKVVNGSNISEYTFTTESDTTYIIFQGTGSMVDTWFNSLMLVTGSTALPYEPYGRYKIPISSGGTTTNEYLGAVQSTRQIYEFVLTGNEAFNTTTGGFYLADLPVNYLRAQGQNLAKCSHYPTYEQVQTMSGVPEGYVSFSYDTLPRLYFKTADYSTLTDFKTYLQQQYANGTPVTVWYVLATSTTGIVNEPIRKIGTYADTVTNPVTIPTTGTAETFDVDTTLKPSEVSLTYHGWHEHEDTKYTTP